MSQNEHDEHDEWIDTIPTCDICKVEMRVCHRCRNCHGHWCLNCVAPKSYDCSGGNHHFSEECCDNCVPEYGRVNGVTGEYFCPRCAPPPERNQVETLEYNFKRAVYKFQEKITAKNNWSSSLSLEYLNNPVNWNRDREELEREWTEMMTRHW